MLENEYLILYYEGTHRQLVGLSFPISGNDIFWPSYKEQTKMSKDFEA